VTLTQDKVGPGAQGSVALVLKEGKRLDPRAPAPAPAASPVSSGVEARR